MKVRIGPKFAILTALVLLLEVIPREAAAKVQQLCVDPSDASCSSTIQDAVNEAKGSAVVTVVAGTFTENVTINYAKAKALTLTIAGAGVGSTIIDGGNDGHVFYVGPKTTLTLSGLTIQDGNTGENGVGGGLYSLSAAITIENCLITGNNADIGGGLYLNGGSLNLVGSTVSNNTAYTPYSNITLVESYELGGGMYFRGNKLTITNSTFTGNTANTGGGMMLVSGTTTIHGSTISDNSANPIVPPGGGGVFIGAEGGGIFVGKSSLTMLNSTISGNAAVPVPAYL
ncbi:MAG TPA: hypothetical protein VMD75_13495, partial [Candidatus Binataceae bacterium]|nr:hypothetical protein [Candidatus Binataceae bacterium]